MSAQWPSALSSASNLYTAVNLLTTTLSVSMTSSTPSVITLGSTTGFPTAGAVTIDNEVIFYTGVSGSTLTGLTRGADGTTAASHSSGVPVGATIVANFINALTAEVIAIETDLHARFGYGSSAIAIPGGVSFTSLSPIFANLTGTSGVPAIVVGTAGNGFYAANADEVDLATAGSARLAASAGNLVSLGCDFYPNVATVDIGQTSHRWGTGYFHVALDIDATSNQAIFGTTHRTTVSFVAPAADRLVSFQDAGADANVVMSEGAQTLHGQLTLTNTGGNPIHGISTNTPASAGYVGEVLESKVTSLTTVGTSNQYFDATSKDITAGNWLVCVVVNLTRNSATYTSTDIQFGLSTTSGNSGTGLVNGDTALETTDELPVTFTSYGMAIGFISLSVTTTTTYYLKLFPGAYSAGSPKYQCRMTAVRTN